MKCRYLYYLLCFLGLSFSSGAWAAETCVSSASDFEQKKDQFPQIVQQLPVMLTTDGMWATAGLKIRTVGDKLKLEGYVWKVGGIYADDGYLRKVCYNGSTFKVTLENGKTYEAVVKSNRTVAIQGVTFKKSSSSEFASIVEKVKKAGGSQIRTTSGNGVQ